MSNLISRVPIVFLAVISMIIVSTQPASASSYFITPEGGPNLVLIPLLHSPILLFLWFLLDAASLYWLGINEKLRLVSSAIFLTWSGYVGLLVAAVIFGIFQAVFVKDHPLLWFGAWFFFTISFALGKTAFSARLQIALTPTPKRISLTKKFKVHMLISAVITTIALVWCLIRRDEWSRYSDFSEYPDNGSTLVIFVGSLIVANIAVFVQRRIGIRNRC